MSSNFSFPPPPPAPPRQPSYSNQQTQFGYQQHARGGRGGRGGQHFNHRGGPPSRGSRGYGGGFHSDGRQHQQNGQGGFHNGQQQQPWAPNMNGWAAQQAQNMMALYSLGNMPSYAQSLPQTLPGTVPQPTQPLPLASEQHDNSFGPRPNNHIGQKRKREEVSREPAAPPVPTFGAPIPQWRPQSSESVTPTKVDEQSKPSKAQKKNQQKKRQKQKNQLGLTPQGEERDESDEDVDEEAAFAAVYEGGPMTISHGSKTIVLANATDIKGWIDNRRKNFPSKARAEQKRQEEARIRQERDKMQRELKEARRKENEENRRKKEQKRAQRGQKKQKGGQGDVKQSTTSKDQHQPPEQHIPENRAPVQLDGSEPCKLYIGNTAFETTEPEVKQFLEGINVESVEIPLNYRDSHPCGYIFVTVPSAADAQRAIERYNKTVLKGREVTIELKQTSEDLPRDKAKAKVSNASVKLTGANTTMLSAGQQRPKPTMTQPDHKSDVIQHADVDLSQQLKPSKQKKDRQKADKHERLRAKAEKYRKLADEAEIAALEAKAKALGYSLMKTEQHSETKAATSMMPPASAANELSADKSAIDTSMSGHSEPRHVSNDGSKPAASHHDQARRSLEELSSHAKLPGLGLENDKMIEGARNSAPEASNEHHPEFATEPSPEPLNGRAAPGEDSEALFTLDVAGDPTIRAQNLDTDMAATLHGLYGAQASDDSASSLSSDSSSDSETDSDSSDPDSSSEEEEEAGTAPTIQTEPQRDSQSVQNSVLTNNKRKPCRAMLQHGSCRFGDKCNYSHDVSQIRKQQPKKAEEQRKSLHERLVEQQNEERHQLVLSAIRYLGDQGVLDEENSAKTDGVNHNTADAVKDTNGGNSRADIGASAESDTATAGGD